MISQLLALPRWPLLPLEGEDVAHIPVQHGPNHEDRGVVCLCRTPKEREEDNSTETIGMSAVPIGHPGAGLGLAWRGLWPMPPSLWWDAMPAVTTPGLHRSQEGLRVFGVTRHPRHLQVSLMPNDQPGAPPFRNPTNPSDSTAADKSAGRKGLLQPPRGIQTRL